MEIFIVSIILMVTLVLLVTEKLSLDVTSIGIMTVLSVTGILTPVEAVSGFANPAVVTVAAMFLISRGMIRTGAVELLSERVGAMARGRSGLAVALVFVIVAFSSAFLNNTPVVVLFIPVIMSMSCEYGLSPSKYLIPLSYVSILAGTCTLIGTSTNIIVSDLSAGYGFGEIGMFELSAVGVPLAILGMVYLRFAAPRLLPDMANPTCELENTEHRKYLSQFVIPKDSPLVDKDPVRAFSELSPTVEIIELVRYDHIYYPNRDAVKIAPDDRLLLKGSATDLVKIIKSGDVALPHPDRAPELSTPGEENVTVEIIIPPLSYLIGARLMEVGFLRDPGLRVIAIQRSGLHYSGMKIHDIKLKLGDILLVQVPWEKLDGLRQVGDIIIVEDVHHRILDTSRVYTAGLIFLGVVSLASTGILNIMVSAIAGVFLMFLTGCLQVRDAYRALQGNVLMLIAGTIALGLALEKTGASRLYADMLLKALGGASPGVILATVILLTSISTQLLSNNATAVLVLPIAISAAVKLGVDPRPFIIAVCFGASACYATPIGYQTNLLVYGPGGYRFADYLKMGIPLNLMVLALGTVLIPIFWPF